MTNPGLIASRRASAGFLAEVAADSPHIWWRLNETSGTSFADSSGNGYTGTASGSVAVNQTPVYAGSGVDAASVLGGGGAITSAASAFTTFTVLSLECVFNIANTIVYHTMMSAGYTNTNWGGLLRVIPGGALQWALLDGYGTLFIVESRAGFIVANTDYHVVGTFDGTTKLAKLYLNGNLVGQVKLVASSLIGYSKAVAVDGQDPASSYKMIGHLNEAIFYQSALPSARITAHYTALGLTPATVVDKGADTHWSDRILLLNDDDCIFDASLSAMDIEQNSSGLTSTQHKFAARSMSFNGAGDYLRTRHPSGINFGSSDWTVEFWYLSTGANQAYARTFQTLDGDVAAALGFFFNITSEDFYPTLYGSGAYMVNPGGAVYTVPAGWMHIAFVREGSVFSIFAGASGTGSRVYTQAISGAVQDDSTGRFIIGGQGVGPQRSINACLEQFRVSLRAEYSGSTYTVPTAAFPNHA